MMKFNPLTSRLDLVGTSGGGSGTVTSISEGAGIQATPNPIVGAGSIALDIASLTPETTLAAGDLFAFVDVSEGTDPADQRSIEFADVLTAISAGLVGVFSHNDLADLGAPNDDHTQYLLLAGRAGTANDPTLSTDQSGHLVGSATAGKNLNIKPNSAAPNTGEIQLETGVIAFQASAGSPPILTWDDGTGFVTSFTTVPQAADIAYAWPSAQGGADTVLRNDGAGNLSWLDLNSGIIDHGSLAGLTDDDHTIYALLAGRAGGQIQIGGTASGNPYSVRSNTSDDGSIRLGNVASDVADVIINGTTHDITFEGPTLIKSFLTIHDSKQSAGSYGSANAATVLLKKYGGTLATAGPRVYFARSRGTQSAEAAIANDDTLGRLDFLGYGGTIYRRAARIIAEVDDIAPDDTQIGGLFRFQTAGSPGALADRLVLDSAGYATFSGSVGIRNVLYTWPAANAAGVLTNDGAGALSWAAATGTIIVQEGDVTVDAAVTTLDFTETDGTLVTSSPAGEANINMDLYFLRSGRPTGRNSYILSSDTSTALLSGGTSGGQNVDFESTTSGTKGTIQFRDPLRFFSNPPSPLTATTAIVTVDTNMTLVSGSASTFRYYNHSHTLTLQDNVSALHGSRFVPTLSSGASTAFTLGTHVGLIFAPTYTPGSSASMTGMTFRGSQIGPTLSNAGTGNTATIITGLHMAGAFNTNWTTDDWNAVNMIDPTGSGGTATRLGGMHLAALTRGTSNYSLWSEGTSVFLAHAGPAIFGASQTTLTAPTANTTLEVAASATSCFRNASRTAYTPTTAQTISAAGNTILANATFVMISNTTGGNITLTSNPTIANGEDGQSLYILSVGANAVSLSNGNNLRLGNATRQLTQYDMIHLIYSATIGDWIEVSFQQNT